MRIGIYGGSFDPIHVGHLILAECAAETLRLDQVRFLPANLSPLKQSSAPTETKHRVEMVKLAIGGNPRFHLDTREIDRGGVSYTIDTVKSLRAAFHESELWLLMGADSLKDFSKWRSPTELLHLVQLGVMRRPLARGEDRLDWSLLEPFCEGRDCQSCGTEIAAPLLELSSTDIRHRLEKKISIRYSVPAAVEAYIRQHNLYRQSPSA
jgi:nicotinate-nucleotide adenylyltransferase